MPLQQGAPAALAVGLEMVSVGHPHIGRRSLRREEAGPTKGKKASSPGPDFTHESAMTPPPPTKFPPRVALTSGLHEACRCGARFAPSPQSPVSAFGRSIRAANGMLITILRPVPYFDATAGEGDEEKKIILKPRNLHEESRTTLKGTHTEKSDEDHSFSKSLYFRYFRLGQHYP